MISQKLFSVGRRSAAFKKTLGRGTSRFSTNMQGAGPAQSQPRGGLGSRAFEYFLDHPWHVFGPLLLSGVVWLVRSNVSLSNQEKVSDTLDAISPVHPREISSIGKENNVTIGEWCRFLDAIFDYVENELSERPSQEIFDSRGNVMMKPSILEHFLEKYGLEGREIQLKHMLRRAASYLAMTHDGKIAVPASTIEAKEFLRTLRRENETIDPPFVSLSAFERLVKRENYILSPDEKRTEGHLFQVRESKLPHNVDIAGYEDAPVPFLSLLFLYSSVMGGKDEPLHPLPKRNADAKTLKDESPPVPIPSELMYPDMVPTPSQRLRLSVETIRRYRHLLRTLEDRASLKDRSNTTQPPESTGIRALPSVPHGPTVYTLDEISELVGLLMQTFQIPSKNRTMEIGSKYPFQHWGIADPSVVVHKGLKNNKVNLAKEPTPIVKNAGSGLPPEVNGANFSYTEEVKVEQNMLNEATGQEEVVHVTEHIEVPAPIRQWPSPPVYAPVDPVYPRDWINCHEVRYSILASNNVCAWGECYATSGY